MKNYSPKIFLRSDYQCKNGEFPIYLRIIIACRKKDISLKISTKIESS